MVQLAWIVRRQFLTHRKLVHRKVGVVVVGMIDATRRRPISWPQTRAQDKWSWWQLAGNWTLTNFDSLLCKVDDVIISLSSCGFVANGMGRVRHDRLHLGLSDLILNSSQLGFAIYDNLVVFFRRRIHGI